MSTFERTWRRADYWAFTVVNPGHVPATADQAKYFLAIVDFQESYSDKQAVNQAYQAGLRRWPDDRNLGMAFANYLYAQNQLSSAAEYFRHVIAVHQDYAPAYNNLAHLYYEQGNYSEALQLALKAKQLGSPDIPAYDSTLQMIRQRLGQLANQ